MGWCSGTIVFDNIMEPLLDEEMDRDTKKRIITITIYALEEKDWDCHQDSDYWDDDLVQEAMRELHPDWFEEEDY